MAVGLECNSVNHRVRCCTFIDIGHILQILIDISQVS